MGTWIETPHWLAVKKAPTGMQFFGVQAKTYLFSKRQINEDEMENDEILRYEIIFPAAGANNGAVLLTRTSLVLSPKEGRKKYINIYIYIYRYHKNNT